MYYRYGTTCHVNSKSNSDGDPGDPDVYVGVFPSIVSGALNDVVIYTLTHMGLSELPQCQFK